MCKLTKYTINITFLYFDSMRLVDSLEVLEFDIYGFIINKLYSYV